MGGLHESPCNKFQCRDVASYETQLGSSQQTLSGGHHDSPCEKGQQLGLSEYEAICRVREYPHEKISIVLEFAQNDLDNPRNWSKARKWYITCFVSMLNVLTYESKSPPEFLVDTHHQLDVCVPVDTLPDHIC
jgi:hypothetical protein